MTRLKPSEVRKQILDQHAALRVHLDALQAALDASVASAVLKSAAKEVHGELMRHIDAEEKILLPELQEVDGWGAERVAALQTEHAEQRSLLGALVTSIEASASDQELTERILELITRIRTDMDEEEKTHLTTKVLKDDIIFSEPGT